MPGEQAATVAEQAADLQKELDQTLLETLIEMDRLSREVWEILRMMPLLDEDDRRAAFDALGEAEVLSYIIGDMMERIFSLKERIRTRERQIEGTTNRETRALLESLRLSDILDKNLLILEAILKLRDGLRKLERAKERMTTV